MKASWQCKKGRRNIVVDVMHELHTQDNLPLLLIDNNPIVVLYWLIL